MIKCNHTHSIQLVTDQGAYVLYYHNAESAIEQLTVIKDAVKGMVADWVEVHDDDDTVISVRMSVLNSFLFSTIQHEPHGAGPGEVIFIKPPRPN